MSHTIPKADKKPSRDEPGEGAVNPIIPEAMSLDELDKKFEEASDKQLEVWMHPEHKGHVQLLEPMEIFWEEAKQAIQKIIESIVPEKRNTEFKGTVDGLGYMPRMENTEAMAQANSGWNACIDQIQANYSKIRGSDV